MKTLLVLAEHPELAEAARAALDPAQYRVLHRAGLEEAEPLLIHGLADACLLDVGQTGVQTVWMIEKLVRRAPRCPVIVFAAAGRPDWEEEAYLRGVAQVLTKPLRPRLLMTMLDRLWAAPPIARALPPPPPPPPPPAAPPPLPRPAELAAVPAGQPTQSLDVLRDFSGILTHSLDAEAMLKQFLMLLRDIIGINRGAIFLRQPLPSFPGATVIQESRRLRAAGALGLPTGLLQHFELSFDAGIGAQLLRLGRILRRYSDEARADAEAQKEFELLGSQVAVPILDRETVIGVAVFDARITGEALANPELELIFHLVGQLALAVKNIWLHDQLAANHQILAEILRELSSACVVVSRDLTVLHANKAARRLFTKAERRGGDLEFTDLPQLLGTKVFQVLRTGSAIAAFRYAPEDPPNSVQNVNIVPFQTQAGGLPASALLMVEDLTQTEQLRRLEVEAAGLRLVKAMADRLTHEIGNALVPLSVHQQMLAEKISQRKVDLDFLKIMERDLGDSVKRVTRFASQMRFLAREGLAVRDAFPLEPLLREAFEEARKYQPAKTPELIFGEGQEPVVLSGDRAALKHALAEVMLNALQANPAQPRIDIHLQTGGDLQIEVQDNGAGFTTEAVERASAPFFTTRNVGLGLGLTVTRKIIENHHGKLEILPPKAGQTGVVRISLPLEEQPAEKR